ncbi:MAG TPA: phospholipase D-like domain-containing protein [Thermoanaerobaculia bacterium]|jgi:phosphatidylserine/phosphatidylglycerophosphate/cardiolipin synthase-like enzyme|nr:phospholipase D-like domain-containing protein [Thermoanaerobaculia bacterium]
MKIIAVSNNDIALTAWSFDKKLPGCVGFAVYRIDMNAGTETPLPALAGFKGDPDVGKPGHTTEQAPVQKFLWKDLFAKRGGLYKYKVVPLQGTFPNLQPVPGIAPLISNPVQLSPNRGVISSYFNRGILATQATARALTGGKGGSPSQSVLLQRIVQPNDPLRKSLAGDLITAVKCLVDRARQQGGACYGALYELTDPELKQELIGAPFVHLVLSDAGTDDEENKPARTALHESHVDIVDRLMPKGHIGHNKFMVYADAAGKPAAVLLGSTNWTANGLCAQTNNSLVIESPALAAEYKDYWDRLHADTVQAGGVANKLQSPTLRSDDNHVRPVKLEDNSAEIDLWFSPNTKSTSKTSTSPNDMAQVFDLISKAQQAVLFLVFQPGAPSIVDAAAAAQKANPQLLVRGAVTDPKAVGEFNTDLFHDSSQKPITYEVVAATGVEDQFGVWEKELNQAGHAIIHDKIVVIDPFSENSVVVTGSHNLGWRASSNNDENLVIVKGHRGLAEAYATHVLDVYDHYRWRYRLKQEGFKNAFQSLDPTDGWQDKYFDAQGRLDNPELKLWLSVDPNAQARRNDAGLGSTRTPVRPPAGPGTPGTPSGGAAPATAPPAPAKKAARKAPAKKAPAKKTATKKTAVKKAPAKKTVARPAARKAPAKRRTGK